MTQYRRRRLAHPPPVGRFNEPVVLFVTACALDRGSHFDNERAHAVLSESWESARQWRVAEYLIMPDHVHLFCVPGVYHPEPIRRWSRYWKRLAGGANASLKSVWQDDIWDRQFRTREQLEEKRHYVRMNPVRAGLCATVEDWPYRAVLRDIVW
jgi:REP element-mobilizing transposase RayT